MNIALLNESFLTQDHIQRLKKLGNIEIMLDTDTLEKAKERIKDKDIIIADVFLCPLSREVLDCANKLKLIVINSTSTLDLDEEYCKEKNIATMSLPNFSTDSVAEQVFSLLLNLARNEIKAVNDNKNSPFEIFPEVLEHRKYMGFNLSGKTLGVIGLGNIGIKVAQIARGFNMNVVAYNRSQKSVDGVSLKSFDEVITQSDVIVSCLPSIPQTKEMYNKEVFEKMKSTALLVVISENPVVNEKDLIQALQENIIGGFASDIYNVDNKDHPLLNMDNVVIAPHLGWYTKESTENMGELITQNIEKFVKNLK